MLHLPLIVELPDFIEAEVTYTEPGVKGDTATNTLKPISTIQNQPTSQNQPTHQPTKVIKNKTKPIKTKSTQPTETMKNQPTNQTVKNK